MQQAIQKPLQENTPSVRRYLKLHGRGSMAYSTLQPGLEFYLVDGLGYFAYLALKHPVFAPRGLNVMIGDPIAAVEDYEALLDEYLHNLGTAAAFVHISEDFASILSRRGFPVNQMGPEWEIDLKSFDFDLGGRDFTHLRRWRNKAQKEGVKVFEESVTCINRMELEAISADWLKRKGGQEYIGLNRPLAWEDEEDVRCFFASHGDRLVSVAVFDPMYKDGRVFAYLHNLSRTHSDAPHGTNDLMILEAMRKFSGEGVNMLSLGLSPLALLEDGKFGHNSTLRKIFSVMYKWCPFIYPFQGNHFHKEKYRGRIQKMYAASIPGISFYRVLGIFKALQIL